jgi:hypothetical protein
MPALGPLLVADYSDFINSDHLDEQTTPDKLLDDISLEGSSIFYSRLGISIDFEGPASETMLAIVAATTQVRKAADVYVADNNFEQKLTVEQQYWLKNSTFHGNHISPTFHTNNLVSAINALAYFTAAKIGHRIVTSTACGPTETLLEEIQTVGFANGLRNAASATVSFWNIMDRIVIGGRSGTPETVVRRVIDHASEISDFKTELFDKEGNLDPEIKDTIEKTKKRIANSSTYNMTSSGCPIRHTSLGPNIQSALKPEQWKSVEHVAEIDEQGIIRYTWDPFRATTDYFVPRIREAISLAKAKPHLTINY